MNMQITNRIITGELTAGTWVEIEGTITEGNKARGTTQAGYFVETRPTDWDDSGELYHYFRDGHINGTPQSIFGLPAKRLSGC
jgi:hypothetical protein